VRTLVYYDSLRSSEIGIGKLRRFIAQTGLIPIENFRHTVLFLMSIPDGSELHQSILKASGKSGITLTESFRVHHCEDADFEGPKAPQYCKMVVKQAIEFDIDDVIFLEHECPEGRCAIRCGLPKLGQEPFPIDVSMIENPLCRDGSDQTIISAPLLESIQSAALSGLAVFPTIDVAQEPSSYFRIQPSNVLPPLSPQTGLYYIGEPCINCIGRNLFYDGFLTYKEEALKNIPDFNVTSESFGHGLIFPQWIVHRRVRELLRNQLGLPDDLITWHPIAFEK